MRIQHNIPAMSSYRNYTRNVSAVNKNLEKLSSGYKINRAGDDAAGLAISEKMRLQISGLEQAQNNAKSGINLVQTAEGALTEVHDMLNRMYTLAEQSANGTYSDEVDREQLQKEVNSLRTEINRIADATNYNGINLLDGSLESGAASATYEKMSANDIKGIMLPFKSGATGADVGVNTVLESDASSSSAGFRVSLNGVNHVMKTVNGTDDLKVTVGGVDIGVSEAELKTAYADLAVGDTVNSKDLAAALAANNTGDLTIGGNTYTMVADGEELVFTAKNNLDTDTNRHLDVTITGLEQEPVAAVPDVYTSGALTQSGTANSDTSVTINYVDADGKNQSKEITFKIGAAATNTAANLVTALNADKDLKELFTAAGDNNGVTFTSKVAGATVKVTGISAGTGIAIAEGSNTTKGADAYKNGTDGYVNYGTEHIVMSTAATIDQLASTTLDLSGKLTDGAKIKLGDETYTIALGEDSKFKDVKNAVYLADANAAEADIASKLSEVAKDNKTFTVSHQNDDAQIGLKQKAEVKDSTDMSTMDKLASYIGVSTVDTSKEVTQGKALSLQIGDTADDFNKLNVNVKDMHATAMGIGDIDISTQEGASEAMKAIKNATNYVSDVRGDLGALQNRLDHTINNLSVTQENIQDAESTIRDVDIAKEMMAYTKNNILVQSAQAMLAQANQLPQGVLQLLG